MVLGFLACLSTVPADAVEFKTKGLWQFSFSAGQKNLVEKLGNRRVNSNDTFDARQRIRLQLDAVASEALSGTVYFEIGNQLWGRASQGAAMGADGAIVKVRQGYLDWLVPRTDLKIRMGIQNINLPRRSNLLGGLVIENLDVAGITASAPLSEQVSLTGFWLRPFNDNYQGATDGRGAGYLDNMDLFGLTLPMSLSGVEATPWVMYGMRGRHVLNGDNPQKIWNDGWPTSTLGSNPFGYRIAGDTSKAWGSMFWAGLPVGITAFDPWNFEFDINYGYVEKMGRYDVGVYGDAYQERAGTRREGWVVSALAEYKMDWGIPGVFAWYASGDDGNLKNGSERMPSIAPWSKFSSTLGGNTPFPTGYVDWSCNLVGTWGVALRLRDMSFIEDLKHTFRAIYIGGTNSPKMVRYANKRNDVEAQFIDNSAPRGYNGYYLTRNDALLEFNFDSYFKASENMTVGLQLGYVVNMLDHGTWQASDKTYLGDSAAMQDLWKATLYVGYTF